MIKNEVILYPSIGAGMEGTGVPIRLDIWEFLCAKHIKYSSKDAFQEKNLTFDSLQRFLRGN